MKHTALTLTFILATLSSFAQVNEQSRTMSLGEQNALIVEFSDIDVKTVESVWKDFFGAFGKTKKNRKADEWYVTGAEIGSLGLTHPVDLYAQISGGKSNASVVTWIDMKGSFLSSKQHPDTYAKTATLLEDFKIAVKKSVIEEELKEQQKLLGKLEKDLQKLLRENDNLNRTIEQAREKITKAEQDIKQNLQDQVNKKVEIETQQKTVGNVEQKLKQLGSSK